MNAVIGDDVELILAELGGSLAGLAGSRLLVTGASGFLCSYCIDVIAALNKRLADKCQVFAIDNHISGSDDRLAHLRGDDSIHFINQDITQRLDLDGKVDWIIHGASIASPVFYRRYPLQTIDVNITGTRNVLDFAAGGARSMLHMSTSEVYGDPEPAAIPTPETYLGNVSCTGPRACYDESKRVSETLCRIYHQEHAVPVKIARPFNVYGPGIRLDDGRIVPDLVASALRGEELVLYSDGRDTRSFCYVRDAVSAMFHLLLCEANGEAFNVGNPAEISIRDAALMMAEVAAPPRLPVVHRKSDDSDYTVDSPKRRCPDITKIAQATSWTPAVALREGLQRTLVSYRGH